MQADSMKTLEELTDDLRQRVKWFKDIENDFYKALTVVRDYPTDRYYDREARLLAKKYPLEP